MKTLSLADAVALALRQETSPDLRPERLLRLRDAIHPNAAPYYRFLWDLAWELHPLNAVEVGTFCGTSAAHLAAHEGNFVLTIDNNSAAFDRVSELGIDNVMCLIGDSLEVGRNLVRATAHSPVDLVYIDGNHTFSSAYSEYVLFRELVRDGGVMLFDDVGLEMSGNEMEVFWNFVCDPKERVDFLHPGNGFGVVVKDAKVAVPSYEAVIEAASERINYWKATR